MLVATTNAPTRAGRREWVALAVLALPLLLVSMDVSVLYFAVPFISQDLSASATQQLWIFDIYGFVLAGLLITMGALGDRIGRRRLLMFGATAFGIASLAAAYARNPTELIAARALLGVGGATLMPSTLALIRTMFHDGAQRAKALAVWSAVLTGGVALGPVLSGVLLEHFWWGSVFLISAPAMLALLVLAPVLLPEYQKPGTRFDLLSSVLSLAALLPVIFGIKRCAVDGFGAAPMTCIVAGLAVGWAFLSRQRRIAYPMIDLTMLRSRAFSGSLVANTVAMFALIGNAVFLTQYLQLVLSMSPFRAALWSLVPSVGVSFAAPTATALAQRVNRAYVIGGGFAVGAGGFAVLTRVHPTSPLVLILVGAGLPAAGLVVVLTLVTVFVVGAVTPERAGSAAGLMETSAEFGGSLGIAVLGSIGAAAYGSRIGSNLAELPAGAAHGARGSLAGALQAAPGLPGRQGAALLTAARQAFTDGLNLAAVTGMCVLVLAAVLALLMLRRVPEAPEPATAEFATVDA